MTKIKRAERTALATICGRAMHCQGIYKNVIYLSPFGQVDETTFKKVRIPFSDEGEILHVNTLKYKKTNENTNKKHIYLWPN